MDPAGRHLLAILIAASIILQPVTPFIFHAQAVSCTTNTSASPHLTYSGVLYDNALATPVGLVEINGNELARKQLTAKWTYFQGYLSWIMTDTISSAFSNFFKLDVSLSEENLTETQTITYLVATQDGDTFLFNLSNPPDRPGEGFINASGVLYWIPSIDARAMDIGYVPGLGTVIAYVAGYPFTLSAENLAPEDVEALENTITTLRSVPLYTLVLMDDYGNIIHNHTRAFTYTLPGIVVDTIEELSSDPNTTVTGLELTVYPTDASLIVENDTVRFSLSYTIRYVIAYNDSGSISDEYLYTIFFATGEAVLDNTSIGLEDNIIFLNITDYGDYSVAYSHFSDEARPLYYYGSMRPSTFTATSGGIQVYQGSLDAYGGPPMLLYGDWIIAETPHLIDVIEHASPDGTKTLLFSTITMDDPTRSDLDNPVEFHMVVDNGDIFLARRYAVNNTYLNEALSANGYTFNYSETITFLPIVYPAKYGDQVVLEENGILVLFTALIADPDNNTLLLVIPGVILGDPDQLSADTVPGAYKRLYNDGIPYAVELPESWINASHGVLELHGWQVIGYVDDPNGLYGGGYAPLLVARVRTDLFEAFSLDLPYVILNAPRTNLSSIDPVKVYVMTGLQTDPATYRNAIILNYLFGETTYARNTTMAVASTPVWVLLGLQDPLIVKHNPLNVTIHYYHGFFNYNYNTRQIDLDPFMIALVGNTQAWWSVEWDEGFDGPYPVFSYNPLYYNISFSSASGIPVLSYNIVNASGGPVDHVFIVDLGWADGSETYMEGATNTILAYSVSAQFQALPLEPSLVQIPLLSPGMTYLSIQGFAWNGVMIVGSIIIASENNTVANISTSGGPTRWGEPPERYPGILESIFTIDEAMAGGTTVTIPCDYIAFGPISGGLVCINATYVPGSLLVIVDDYKIRNTPFPYGLGKAFVYNAQGVIARITGYYEAKYDNGSIAVIEHVICDGDCGDLTASSPCGALTIPYRVEPPGVQDTGLVAFEIVLGETGSGGGGPTFSPPPPGNITLPEPGNVATPSITEPSGIMTLLLFVALYVYYNQRMTQGQALAVAAALSGVISSIIWGPEYLTIILVMFGVGIVLYYVLQK